MWRWREQSVSHKATLYPVADKTRRAFGDVISTLVTLLESVYVIVCIYLLIYLPLERSLYNRRHCDI